MSQLSKTVEILVISQKIDRDVYLTVGRKRRPKLHDLITPEPEVAGSCASRFFLSLLTLTCKNMSEMWPTISVSLHMISP